MKLQSLKPTSINKIVVVGHPLSGYKKVETLLNISGMSPALPSRRDEFLPTEISTTVCKAHRVPLFNALHTGEEIKQLDVGPIWNGMALDLLLGNIDQEFWGWADPQSVYLLDYWKALDPQLAFVLVYDTPQQLLVQTFDTQTPFAAQALQKATDNWTAFNAALLHFYLRNPERCLLVHAQQVRESSSIYLQQVRMRIGAPVLDDAPYNGSDDSNDNDDSGDDEIGVDGTTLVASKPVAAPNQVALKAYIADALLQEQPRAMQLYEELQSIANLPLSEHLARSYTPLDAWVSMAAQQAHQAEQFTQAQAIAQAQDVKIQSLSHCLSGTQALADERQQRVLQEQQENELVLLQLHQVQEELEQRHLKIQQAKTEAEKIAIERQTQIDDLKQTTAQFKVALVKEKDTQIAQINQQLASQVELAKTQAAQISALTAKAPVTVNPELEQENELLLQQIHQVQEELERYYLENQQLKQRSAAPHRPAETVAYGAAERVKRQLSYRLGHLMIQRSRTLGGVLGLPWALMKETREFRKSNAKTGDKKLPPLHQYRDAAEGRKAQQHLSYRLGATLITHSKTPIAWIKMPFALRREVKAFRQQRQGSGSAHK